MNKDTLTEDTIARIETKSVLDEIVREGAKKLLQFAVNQEVEDYIQANIRETDQDGKRMVVRNGWTKERNILTSAGSLAIKKTENKRQTGKCVI